MEKIVYRVHASAIGGINRRISIPDNSLQLKLTSPKETGGNVDSATPEQLFAAGYSACFLSAMEFVASRDKITMPTNVSVNCSVGIGAIPNGFGIIEADLKISLPGLASVEAEALIAKAHIVCRYSNAIRGNINVKLTIA